MSTSQGKIHLQYGTVFSGVTLDVVGFDEKLRPRCEKKAHKEWHCEYTCRCTRNGELLCATGTPFYQFRPMGLSKTLSPDRTDAIKGKISMACSSACSCLHLQKEDEAGPSREGVSRTGEASSRSRPPLLGEASTSGSGPRTLRTIYGFRPPQTGEAPSKGVGPGSEERRPEIELALISDPGHIQGPSGLSLLQVPQAPSSDPGHIQRRWASRDVGGRSKQRQSGR
jgi:hypothetical protein